MRVGMLIRHGAHDLHELLEWHVGITAETLQMFERDGDDRDANFILIAGH